MRHCKFRLTLFMLPFLLPCSLLVADRPNIVLVMADDQGWGQTGYQNHPILKTPNLDAMADAGLRFNRFYAAAPVCSPTRASVLTGRTNMRTGVESHGYALRLQEKTIAQALHAVGYATGHFGKWHLNGMRGPGVPIFAKDTHHPGRFGFETWLSVTNFFDRNPVMSRNGVFEEFSGDSSEIIVEEALQFIAGVADSKRPFFTVIWFGTPHSPFRATQQDTVAFNTLPDKSKNHYGELVAMDRSIGQLRERLRELGVAENTLVWFCSDNGGLPRIEPDTVGGLRGHKGSLYEGGIRVPCIVEWPQKIQPRITEYPAVAMDIFPTIASIIDLKPAVMLSPQDGLSLEHVFTGRDGVRPAPIPFQCFGNTALVDNNYKLIHTGKRQGRSQKSTKQYELYDLAQDPAEELNLYATRPKLAKRMTHAMDELKVSLGLSVAGDDYPQKAVASENPSPRAWKDVDAYEPYFKAWRQRPEYRAVLSAEPR